MNKRPPPPPKKVDQQHLSSSSKAPLSSQQPTYASEGLGRESFGKARSQPLKIKPRGSADLAVKDEKKNQDPLKQGSVNPKLPDKPPPQEGTDDKKPHQDKTPAVPPGSGIVEPTTMVSNKRSKSATDLDTVGDDPRNRAGSFNKNLGLDGTNEELEEAFVTRHMLYKEAMYTSVHYLGKETERFPCGNEKMCMYVHEAFSTSPQEQQAVIDHVKTELFPMIGVNTRILKGEELSSPDSKSPNSYCVIAIEQEGSMGNNKLEESLPKTKTPSVTKRLTGLFKQKEVKSSTAEHGKGNQFYDAVPPAHKTVVKPHDKNPIWDQAFQCVSLTPSTDALTVEVWNRVDDDTLRKSIDAYNTTHRISSSSPQTIPPPPKSSSSKGDIFLGKVSKLVHEISCEGFEKTMPLENVQSAEPSHGNLRLRIWLVHLYRHGKPYVEMVDKRTMLSCLWDWILSFEKKRQGQQWDGKLPPEALCLLYQYALQTGISEDTHSYIRWDAYAKHKLDLDGITKPLKDIEGVLEKRKSSGLVVDQQKNEDSQLSIEDSIIVLMDENIFPIIRNHLREPESQVSKALKAYKDCENVLKKFEPSFALPILRGLMEKALRLCFLEWYQATYALRVKGVINNADACQKVKLHVELMNEVNNLLTIGMKKWQPEFWMLAEYEPYMTVMYDELQKMVNYDIEMVCWSLLQHYDDNRKLRQILKLAQKQDECTVSALFSLYAGTQSFVNAQDEIFPNESPHHYENLANYHRWFRPVLVLWLGFAVVRGSEMITRCVNIDNVTLENVHAKTSTSALDTATVIHQLVHFWEKLMWPDVCEKYVVIHFLLEVMCYFTILYAERKLEKLELEGYFDTEDRFDISERLCVALNNIEYVKEIMEGVTEEIKYEQLIQDLENECGVTRETTNYRKRLKQAFTFSIGTVELVFTCILKGVGERVQPEIKRCVQDSLKILQTLPIRIPEADDETLLSVLDPIFSYVDSNIVTLSQSLLTLNFARMLQLFWNTILQELLRNGATIPYKSEEERGALFSKIILVIPLIRKYFATGDTGLNEDELNTPVYWEVHDALNQYTVKR